MEKCGVQLLHGPPAAVTTRSAKSAGAHISVPEHYLQNMDSLGLQQLEHLEKELEQAKQKVTDLGLFGHNTIHMRLYGLGNPRGQAGYQIYSVDYFLEPRWRLEKIVVDRIYPILVLKAQEHRETASPENKVSESRYWTNEERQRFKKALKTFGTDFAAIAKFVGTRSSTQVRTHAQKYYAKLIRDYKRSGKAGPANIKGSDANKTTATCTV